MSNDFKFTSVCENPTQTILREIFEMNTGGKIGSDTAEDTPPKDQVTSFGSLTHAHTVCTERNFVFVRLSNIHISNDCSTSCTISQQAAMQGSHMFCFSNKGET